MLDLILHNPLLIRMNTDTSVVPNPSHLQPVPPEPAETPFDNELQTPQGLPRFYRDGKFVVVEYGAAIPTRTCIKCGRPAKREVSTGLRQPSNPVTWFGKRPNLDVGLCRKHHENHAVAVALTWSILGVGVLLLVAGALTSSLVSCLLGVIAIVACGVFRASTPVTSEDASDDHATVAGAGEAYRKQLSQKG